MGVLPFNMGLYFAFSRFSPLQLRLMSVLISGSLATLIEFTILISLILLSGIYVANKQVPIAKAIASMIGKIG